MAIAAYVDAAWRRRHVRRQQRNDIPGDQVRYDHEPGVLGQSVNRGPECRLHRDGRPSHGSGSPTGTVIFTIDGKAGSPVALTEVAGKDQANTTMPAVAAGSYTITASYSGDANFAPSASSPVTQVVNPSATAATTVTPTSVDGPTVVSVLRYGYHMMPTTVVLTFDQALDATTAQDGHNYRITGLGGRVIGIKSAVYDPTTLTVTLHPKERISVHHTYELIVDGTAPHGLTNTLGQLLDGVDAGRPDSDYRTSLTWRNLVLDPVPPGMSRWPRRTIRNGKLKLKTS